VACSPTSDKTCVAAAACAPGKYTSGSSCSDCGAGKFEDQQGATKCIDCAAGKFTSAARQTSCTACASGKYKASAGTAGCDDCTKSTYSASSESTTCTACPTQSTTASAGQTAFIACKCSTGITMTNGACTASGALAACPAGKTRLKLTQLDGGGSSCIAAHPCVLKPTWKGTTGFTEGVFTWQLSCSVDGAQECVDGKDEMHTIDEDGTESPCSVLLDDHTMMPSYVVVCSVVTIAAMIWASNGLNALPSAAEFAEAESDEPSLMGGLHCTKELIGIGDLVQTGLSWSSCRSIVSTRCCSGQRWPRLVQPSPQTRSSAS